MNKEKCIDERNELIKLIYCTPISSYDNRTKEELVADLVLASGYRKQSEWISVEDRLPAPYDKDPDWSETVLFRTIQGHIHSGYRYKGKAQTSFYDDDWSSPYWLDESENLSFEEEEVTHWMPLPAPPTEKEN